MGRFLTITVLAPIGAVYSARQRLVQWRERRLIASLCRRVGAPACVLDQPPDDGRFAPLLSRSTPLVVCADIGARRLVALEAALSCTMPARSGVRTTRWASSSRSDLVVHLRYLQHADAPLEHTEALAELVRVSGRYIVLSYFRRGRLRGAAYSLRDAPRRSSCPRPTMIAKRDLARLVAGVGCRIVTERSVLSVLHAHRVVLVEKLAPGMLLRRGDPAV